MKSFSIFFHDYKLKLYLIRICSKTEKSNDNYNGFSLDIFQGQRMIGGMQELYNEDHGQEEDQEEDRKLRRWSDDIKLVTGLN